MITLILIIVFAAAVIAAVKGSRAGRRPVRNLSAQPLQSADESGPTTTGRYRVQQMFASTRRTAGQEAHKPAPVQEAESSLPDPFSLKDLPEDETSKK